MSKFILKKRVSGFTITSNNVIHSLKCNLQALGFYLYLLSLPDNWEFYKTNLSKECSIGIKKVDKLLQILKSYGLVKYGQERNEKGQFERFFLEIYDVEQIKQEHEESYPQDLPDGNFCRAAKTVGRIGEAIKEEIKNKNKKLKNKRGKEPLEPQNRLTLSDFKNRLLDFTEEEMQIASELGVANIALVFEKFKTHLQIKSRTSFLREEFKLWLLKERPEKHKSTKIPFINSQETRCTVPEWGPGHPSYDSLHARN